MKTEWEVKRFEEVIESNVIGLTVGSSEQGVNRKYKYVKMNNITSENRFNFEKYVCVDASPQEAMKYNLVKGDFLFNTRNSYELVGKTCVFQEAKEEVILYNNNIMRIRFIEGVNSSFINYAFSSDSITKKIDKLKSGTTNVSAIYFKDLKNLLIPIPPIPEQQRIVAILDEAFAAIDKAKENAQKNLQNARALFESYLQSVFANPGEGWEKRSLENLCELIVDCEHKTAPIQETGYPSIRTPNIGPGMLILDKVNRVSEETYKEWTKRAVPKAGDLILAREAPAGNVAAIPEGLQVCLGQRTVLIRPNNKILVPKYLMRLLLSKYMQELLLSNSRGATVEHVNMKDIRNLKINNIPSLDEQQTIVAKLDALSAETKKLEAIYQQKLIDLDELKKAILQKAFQGELTTTSANALAL